MSRVCCVNCYYYGDATCWESENDEKTCRAGNILFRQNNANKKDMAEYRRLKNPPKKNWVRRKKFTIQVQTLTELGK